MRDRPSKKSKTDLTHLLSRIQGEKKGTDATATQGLSTSDHLNGEYVVYSKMPELKC